MHAKKSILYNYKLSHLKQKVGIVSNLLINNTTMKFYNLAIVSNYNLNLILLNYF